MGTVVNFSNRAVLSETTLIECDECGSTSFMVYGLETAVDNNNQVQGIVCNHCFEKYEFKKESKYELKKPKQT
jgi:hypothetical protein